METSADGEGRGRPAVDGGRHIGRVDVGRNAQDPSVQVEATAPEPRRGGQEQIVETVAATQPCAPRLCRLSPRRGEPLSNYLYKRHGGAISLLDLNETLEQREIARFG